MARGGKRSGTPGTAYPNRTDLSLPPTAVPNQPYGVGGAQLAAQQQIPMAAPGGAPPSPPGAASAPPPPGPPPVAPGGLGALNRPTERPGEHVMSGVATGPGPGPEAIPGMSGSVQTLGSLLSNLAKAPNSTPEVAGLANFVNQGRL